MSKNEYGDMAIETEHKEMVKNLAKPPEEIISNLQPMSTHLLHMSIGMAGEIGELLNAIWPKGEPAGEDIDMGNVLEELGDYHFYFVGFTDTTGFNRTRYPEGDTDENVNMGKALVELTIHTMDILDLVKKVVIYNKGSDSLLTLEMEFLVNRISDNLFIIRQFYGIHLDVILMSNIRKLTKGTGGKPPRYSSGKYSDEAAQNRADKSDT